MGKPSTPSSAGTNRAVLPLLILIWEVLMIIGFCFLTTFDDELVKNVTAEELEKDAIRQYYGFFQDVNVMIFVGFGFLMAFLKGHSLASIALNFLVAVLTVQTSILLNHLFHAAIYGHYDGALTLDIPTLIGGDFAAGAVLIAFGAVLGRVTPLQTVLLPLLLLPFYALNESIAVIKYQSVDMGGSMIVHLFGAFFGVACAAVLKKRSPKSKATPAATYNTNMIAFIGTLFLWMYWPSFNGALAVGNSQHRVVVNTVLGLTASCASTFALSQYLEEGRFNVEHLLNATLAGGVAIGSSSDLVVSPWSSLLIGSLAGIISTLCYHYVGPLMNSSGTVDTCGVLFLHGIPGVLGGVCGAISCAFAGVSVYGESVSNIFPAMGDGRTAGEQAGYQLACLFTSLGFSIVGGLIAGFCLSLLPSPQEHYNDHFMFVDEEDEEAATKTGVIPASASAVIDSSTSASSIVVGV